jgi:hypothetical protein
MVLEFLPNNLDQVQFRTVGRQMNQECTMVNEPTIEDVLRNVVVDAGVIVDGTKSSTEREVILVLSLH